MVRFRAVLRLEWFGSALSHAVNFFLMKVLSSHGLLCSLFFFSLVQIKHVMKLCYCFFFF